ncbi:MAG TPA: hypothetical protein VHM27_01740 [Rhizomicrobium sp.]|nr:hypothetical protein [Rhizomicrobium sp.]
MIRGIAAGLLLSALAAVAQPDEQDVMARVDPPCPPPAGALVIILSSSAAADPACSGPLAIMITAPAPQ